MIKLILTEQARSRSNAIKIIEGLQPVYEDHLLKCIIYGNSINNLWHWIDEIINIIIRINEIKIKTPSGRLSNNDYLDYLFLAAGESELEYRENLRHFMFKYKYKYPKFEITNELVTNTTDLFLMMSNYSMRLSETNSIINENAIRNDILDFLEDRGIIT